MKQMKKIGLEAARAVPEGAPEEEMQYPLYDREQAEDIRTGAGSPRVPGVPEVFRRMKKWIEE